jgi:hypothetical protein
MKQHIYRVLVVVDTRSRPGRPNKHLLKVKVQVGVNERWRGWHDGTKCNNVGCLHASSFLSAVSQPRKDVLWVGREWTR